MPRYVCEALDFCDVIDGAVLDGAEVGEASLQLFRCRDSIRFEAWVGLGWFGLVRGVEWSGMESHRRQTEGTVRYVSNTPCLPDLGNNENLELRYSRCNATES